MTAGEETPGGAGSPTDSTANPQGGQPPPATSVVTQEPVGDDLDATAAAAAAAAAPEILADSLGDYLRAWKDRIKAGQSGALPILAGLVLIVIIFQSQQSQFLTAGNLVNLFIQAAVFILLGLAEIFALLLSEIDLSAGFVAAVGAFIICELIAAPYNWPAWAAIVVGFAITAAIGALQGTLITRLRIPSFIVTLGGLLAWQGVMIWLADRDKTAVGGVITISPTSVVYKLVNGNMSPATAWITLIVLVGIFAVVTIVRAQRRRARGLTTPPLSITIATIVVTAAGGVALVAICNVNRGVLKASVRGVPWVVPFVLAVVVLWGWLLGKTRLGRYIYAIGANPEAARRAGINVAGVRTVGFALCSLTAGMAGLVYASRLGSIATDIDGGTLVLYAVAAAVIGGTSLFGGYGKAIHALLGGIVIAAVANGLGLLGIGAAGEDIVTALVLIAAVTVDSLVRRRGTTAPV